MSSSFHNDSCRYRYISVHDTHEQCRDYIIVPYLPSHRIFLFLGVKQRPRVPTGPRNPRPNFSSQRFPCLATSEQSSDGKITVKYKFTVQELHRKAEYTLDKLCKHLPGVSRCNERCDWWKRAPANHRQGYRCK